MRLKTVVLMTLVAAIVLLAGPMPAEAQEEQDTAQEKTDAPQEKADAPQEKTDAPQKDKDKTGTNPVNFTYDFRLYTELQRLTYDSGSQIRQTMEFRVPLGRDIANFKGKGEEIGRAHV